MKVDNSIIHTKMPRYVASQYCSSVSETVVQLIYNFHAEHCLGKSSTGLNNWSLLADRAALARRNVLHCASGAEDLWAFHTQAGINRFYALNAALSRRGVQESILTLWLSTEHNGTI